MYKSSASSTTWLSPKCFLLFLLHQPLEPDLNSFSSSFSSSEKSSCYCSAEFSFYISAVLITDQLLQHRSSSREERAKLTL